jgi:hypothetical protein
MNASEAYDHGHYSSYREVVIATQGIVRELLEYSI